MAMAPRTKEEQSIPDRSPSPVATTGQEIEPRRLSPHNIRGPLNSAVLAAAVDERQQESKPKSAAEITHLANHLAHFHMTNAEGSRSILNNIIRQVVALNKACNQNPTKLTDPRELDMEEHSGGQETPTRDGNATSISSRAHGLLAKSEADVLSSTAGRISSPPTALARQEVKERDPDDDGSFEAPDFDESIDMTEPERPVASGGGDATPPTGNGEPGGQEEGGDETDKEDFPPAPPPSPASVARAAGEDFFRILPSPLGGLGAFAVRELKRDQTILVERPLLRTTHFRLMPDYHDLSEAAKRVYLSLHGGEDGDPFSRVERIKQLNSFAVPGGIAIFEIASRFNHACPSVRNVQYVFDNQCGVLYLTVCQDVVPAGTELSITYGGSTVDLYSTYGFRCSCGGCTPLTDEDIRRMKDLEYGNFGGCW